MEETLMEETLTEMPLMEEMPGDDGDVCDEGEESSSMEVHRRAATDVPIVCDTPIEECSNSASSLRTSVEAEDGSESPSEVLIGS
jgi:hypothetical protein